LRPAAPARVKEYFQGHLISFSFHLEFMSMADIIYQAVCHTAFSGRSNTGHGFLLKLEALVPG
jgi:hypothetical protein